MTEEKRNPHKIEKTLVLIKPDAVQRALIGEIIGRFEDAGMKIVGMKMTKPSAELLKKHYKDDLAPILAQKTKKDWDEVGITCKKNDKDLGEYILCKLREFLMSSPVIAMVIEGVDAVENVRKMAGETGPNKSAPGTIRGDFAHYTLGYASLKEKAAANIIHASGNEKEAEEEVWLWFNKDEIFEYKTLNEVHTF